MEVERARMLTDLRREVGRLVVNTTAKVAGKVLTPDDQQRLTDEANRQLAA
jgi:F-type H+-transporting ATPase subunit b